MAPAILTVLFAVPTILRSSVYLNALVLPGVMVKSPAVLIFIFAAVVISPVAVMVVVPPKLN